ncbi:DUF2269 family protein [Aquipseudomonas campi]
MEHYLLLKIVHSALAVLLPLGLIAHAVMLWRAWRRGDAAVLQRKLRNTRRFSLPALGLVALAMPITGWWLVHLAGWPLGQLWLLISAFLFAVLVILGLLLNGRLAAWQALGDSPAPVKLLRFTAAYALLILLVLLATFALMGAKPV